MTVKLALWRVNCKRSMRGTEVISPQLSASTARPSSYHFSDTEVLPEAGTTNASFLTSLKVCVSCFDSVRYRAGGSYDKHAWLIPDISGRTILALYHCAREMAE